MLGPFQLKICGKPIPVESWRSKKALLLFKYLAARYAEKIPSDVLLDLLWPDADFKAARVNLHSTVYLLRQTLKKHTPDSSNLNWIRSGNNLYWLAISASLFLDLQDFDTLYHRSEKLEAEDPLQALEISLQALKLYRGSFLPEDLYLDWAASIRDRYHGRYVQLVTRTCRLLLKHHRDFKQAADICRNALRHEPYREELHRLLMQCLIGLGRFPEAVLQYQHCAKLLLDEFGLEPSLETRAQLGNIKTPSSLFGELNDKPSGNKAALEPALTSTNVPFQKIKQPLTLLTIELDKSVAVLHLPKIFSVLAKSLRKGDRATQWSDRLIAVILQGADAQDARLVKERILTNLDPQIASACQFTSGILSASAEKTDEQH